MVPTVRLITSDVIRNLFKNSQFWGFYFKQAPVITPVQYGVIEQLHTSSLNMTQCV